MSFRISYRRKIAPFLYANLSRSGLSLSLAPRFRGRRGRRSLLGCRYGRDTCPYYAFWDGCSGTRLASQVLRISRLDARLPMARDAGETGAVAEPCRAP